MRRICPLWLALLLAFAAFPRPAAATSQELRDKLHAVAADILNDTHHQPVTVGVFSPTGLPDTDSGPGIEQALTTELDRISPNIVQPKAKFEVKGDYAYAKSHDPKLADLKVIKITATVIDTEFAEEIARISNDATLDGTKTIAEIWQSSGALPKSGNKADRNEKIDELLKRPSCAIAGAEQTLVKSSTDSPYGVEISVRADGSIAAIAPPPPGLARRQGRGHGAA